MGVNVTLDNILGAAKTASVNNIENPWVICSNMGKKGVGVISEQVIRENNFVHIPEEIHNIFKKEQIEDNSTSNKRPGSEKDERDILYHWCYDSDTELVLASTYQLRDIYSQWHANTKWDPEGHRVRFPEKAADALNVNEGDKLFFVTRDDVESLPVPTIYVFNIEKAEQIMLQQDDEVVNILDRQPNF